MSKKDSLLTIGELSKATNVGIKSLKYYEDIGILRPACIAEGNGYRYFSLKQAYWVEIIQMSVTFGIPLKNLQEYIGENDQIDYQALFAREKIEIQQQLDGLTRSLNFIKHVERDFELMRTMGIHQTYPLDLDEKYFLIEPIKENETSSSLKKAYARLIKKARSLGIAAMFWDTGKLFERFPNGVLHRYVYVQIPKRINESILSPAGTYFCRQSPNEQIDEAETFFPKILNRKSHCLLIEMDIFQQKSSYRNAHKELRVIKIKAPS